MGMIASPLLDYYIILVLNILISPTIEVEFPYMFIHHLYYILFFVIYSVLEFCYCCEVNLKILCISHIIIYISFYSISLSMILAFEKISTCTSTMLPWHIYRLCFKPGSILVSCIVNKMFWKVAKVSCNIFNKGKPTNIFIYSK